MNASEHLQFLALMMPTLVVLALAAVSLADLDIEVLRPQPAVHALAAPAAMDDAGHETAY